VKNIVPGSDGAGTVIATGVDVTRFKPGDAVLTLFFANHSDEPTEDFFAKKSLGSASDGTFRQYGTFNEEGLVAKPSSLSFQQASL